MQCRVGEWNIQMRERESKNLPFALNLFLFVVYHYSDAGELLYGYLPHGKSKGNIIDPF